MSSSVCGENALAKVMSRLRSAAEALRREARVYSRVARDPRASWAARLLLGAALAYALSPIDLIPDFIPIVGHLDDLIVVPLLAWAAMRLIPKAIIEEHRNALRAEAKQPS